MVYPWPICARDVEEFYAGVTAGDFDRAFGIFAEDVVTVEPALGRSASLAEWREYDEAFKAACPDARFVLRSTSQQGDRIAAEGSFRGTFAAPLRTPLRELQPTGRSFDEDFAHFSSSAMAELSSIASTTTRSTSQTSSGSCRR